MDRYLSSHFLNRVEDSLNKLNFLNNDFKIEVDWNSEEDYAILNVRYIYIDEYYFTGFIMDGGQKFQANIVPGNIVRLQQFGILTQHQFFNTIREWLSNIRNEITAGPIARQLDEQDNILKDFQQKIHQMDEKMDSFFSRTEGDELKRKLDELEHNFVQHLEQNEETSSQEIRKLQDEIETLKQQVDALTKKNWFLSFSTRLYLWYQRNPMAARQLAGASRQFLPEEAQTLVSDEVLDQLLLPQETGSK